VSETKTLDALIGKTFDSVTNGQDVELRFKGLFGEEYRLYHYQDCCEDVEIVDICGELTDLVGTPILRAEETVNDSKDTDFGSKTWTFYRFETVKGLVVVRWKGESNGYYSERVTFEKL